MEDLFQFSFESISHSVVLVAKNFTSERRHRLNMPRNDFVKVFKFLRGERRTNDARERLSVIMYERVSLYSVEYNTIIRVLSSVRPEWFNFAVV